MDSNERLVLAVTDGLAALIIAMADVGDRPAKQDDARPRADHPERPPRIDWLATTCLGTVKPSSHGA